MQRIRQDTAVKLDDSRRILEALVSAVIVLDRDLKLIFMNSAAEMLFALSFRQAWGQYFQELATGAEVVIVGLQRCLDKASPYTERGLHLNLPNGQPITVDITVAPLLDQNRQTTELLLELRQVDQQLRISREEHLLAQQDITRSLVRNLAHEIKNPLGGLRGAAQLLEREFKDPALKEYTQVIIGEADRLRNLVDRLLGPNQLPVYQPVNIHELLERVRSLVQAESGPGIDIERDYDPSIPFLRGDADQLLQALLNIVRNAAQALNQHGVITLRTRIQRQYTIGHRRHKLVVRLDIIDNGPGIAEERQEAIFYPMISGRAEGTGLGLSIAQNLVNQHGGLIECTSQSGQTVFSLLLPLEKPREQKGTDMGH